MKNIFIMPLLFKTGLVLVFIASVCIAKICYSTLWHSPGLTKPGALQISSPRILSNAPQGYVGKSKLRDLNMGASAGWADLRQLD